MITTTCDQYSARWWFKYRTPINFAAVLFCFILLVFISQNFIHPLIADVISVGLAYLAFFHVLNNRAIAIVCPHCNGYIETATPWKCGNPNCQKDNEKVEDFPIVHRCQHCGVEQKAFECPHLECRQTIYLGRDKLKNIYARFVKMPEKSRPAPVRRDPIADKKFKQQQEKSDLQHEFEVTQLRGNIKDAKSKIEPVKLKSLRERMREALSNRTDLDDEVRRMRSEADIEFANDEKKRLQRYDEIDDVAREFL
jgi:hypothetical protein